MPDVIDEFGIQIKSVDELRTEMRNALVGSSEFGDLTNTGADSVVGQLIDVFAQPLGDSRESLLAIAASFDTDEAQNIQLDNLVGIVGVIREPATPTKGTVTLGGTPGTPIPALSQVQIPNNDLARFATDAAVVIGGGGTVDAEVTCLNLGAIPAPAGTVTEIVTGVAGWTSVTNAADLSTGRDTETDPELLIRWANSFGIAGAGTEQAISARVQALTDVESALAISNRGLTTDARGIPGKAVRVVIWPDTGVDEDRVVQEIWGPTGVVSGIEYDGTEEFQVVDSKGNENTVRFSYADRVDIWVIVNITQDPGYGGDSAVADAVLNAGTALGVGRDVLPIDLICAIKDNVEGVRDAEVLIGLANPPTLPDPIVIDIDEISRFDLARITVNS